MERQKDERTDRPYFIRPFWLPLGVQKAKIQIFDLQMHFSSNLKIWKFSPLMVR